ncbi:unnamed protein product [Durusdinium trenchii]|uniref:Uncharacterized protein n=2 Tax=Durusdinium trenchii TaxID=1381693 RepID=A0ABP0RNG7_9DINO
MEIVTGLALGHLSLTHAMLKEAALKLWSLWHEAPPPFPELRQRAKVEEELDKVRIANRHIGTRIMIHFVFVITIESLLRFCSTLSLSAFFEALVGSLVYLHDIRIVTGRVNLTARRVRMINMLLRFMVWLHAVFCLKSDPAAFAYQEKLHLGLIVTLGLEDLDWRLTALHSSAVALLHARSNALQELCTYGLVVVAVAFCEHQTRSRISAVMTSNETASMLQSVRRVLKGVADGDVLLDEEFQILEDGGLARVLGARASLEGCSFRNFLQTPSDDQRFLDFVSDSESSRSSVPRCVRVSMNVPQKCQRSASAACGAAVGPVGVDLFHVKVPSWACGQKHLLAFKEDAESRVHPDAPMESLPAFPIPSRRDSQRSSISSRNDIIDALEELQEATLLLNNCKAYEILEAHLLFKRFKPTAPSLKARSHRHGGDPKAPKLTESPSLQKFSPATEWPSLRKTLDRFKSRMSRPSRESAGSSDAPSGPRRLQLGPLCLRLPGTRSYVRAQETVLSTPDPGPEPQRFWLQLTHLDKRDMTRTHESHLEEILEH